MPIGMNSGVPSRAVVRRMRCTPHLFFEIQPPYTKRLILKSQAKVILRTKLLVNPYFDILIKRKGYEPAVPYF